MRAFHYWIKAADQMACGRPSSLEGNANPKRTTCELCKRSSSWYEHNFQVDYQESKKERV